MALNPRRTVTDEIRRRRAEAAASAASTYDECVDAQELREAACTRHEPRDDDPDFCRHCEAILIGRR